MIAETSRQAFEKIQDKLGDKQQAVYEALGELGVATNEQIADHLGWPIQSVTGRVTELNKLGLVGVEGIGRSKAGNSAKRWGIRDLNDRNLREMAHECEA